MCGRKVTAGLAQSRGAEAAAQALRRALQMSTVAGILRTGRPRPPTHNTQGRPTRKKLAAFIVTAAAAVLSAPASAQFAKAEDAIKYRQSAFFVMGQHFSRIGAMANGKAPFDAKAAQESADIVAVMSKLPWEAFGAGTDKGAPTKALPAIWSEQAKYKEHADKLQAEATKLAAAAKTGNLDNLKASFGATAGTCKACHDAFRSK